MPKSTARKQQGGLDSMREPWLGCRCGSRKGENPMGQENKRQQRMDCPTERWLTDSRAPTRDAELR